MPLFQYIFAKDEGELAMLEEHSTVPGPSRVCLFGSFTAGAVQRQSF